MCTLPGSKVSLESSTAVAHNANPYRGTILVAMENIWEMDSDFDDRTEVHCSQGQRRPLPCERLLGATAGIEEEGDAVHKDTQRTMTQPHGLELYSSEDAQDSALAAEQPNLAARDACSGEVWSALLENDFEEYASSQLPSRPAPVMQGKHRR